MWPVALMTNPVPLQLKLFAAFGGAAPCASGAGLGLSAAALEKSPAPFRPSALTLVTQLAIMLSSGPVDDSWNCSVDCPATATIKLDFWNVRATAGGRIAVSMVSEPALANSRASYWPSKVTLIG